MTHDIELVDPQMQNILHFHMKNDITNYINIHKFSSPLKKVIEESKEILFSKKCLFVEGYADYKVFKCFLEYKKNNDYNVIPMGGCGNQIWYIMNKLNVDYKIIFDMDKLNRGKSALVNFIINHKIDILEKLDFDISLSFIKQKIQNIRLGKIPYFYSAMFYLSIDNCLFNDVLLSEKDKKSITPKKIMDLHNCIIHTNNKLFDDFDVRSQNKQSIDVNIKIFINKYIEMCKKHQPFYDQLSDLGYTYYDFLKEFLFQEICDIFDNEYMTHDNFINLELNSKESVIFVWKSNVKNLEGFSKLLGNKISHRKWSKISQREILQMIQSANNHVLIKEIETFLDI